MNDKETAAKRSFSGSPFLCRLIRGWSWHLSLADIHQPGQAADGTKVQVIEAVLATGQGQHHGVRGSLLDEFGVVAAAGNQEEVLDDTGLHCVNNRVRYGYNGIMDLIQVLDKMV